MRGVSILLPLCLLATAPQAIAQIDYANVQLTDPAQERAAKDLMETIRCVVCQGQSVADSNADLAADMRGLIRERIAAGEQPEAIRAWLIDHYGDWVSFKPQVDAASAPLWGIPILAMLAGLFLIRGRLKRRST
jgi:cytochrome c-type biogenesis protein CcmH